MPRVPLMACRALFGVCLALASCASVHATGTVDLVVIGHPGAAASGGERAELARIFKRRVRVDAAGQAIVPVNLPSTAPLRRVFSRLLLGATPEALDSYWNERYFHGISPPPVVASVEAMLRFVAVTPGAVGYVPACALDGRVQELARFPAVLDATVCAAQGSASPTKIAE